MTEVYIAPPGAEPPTRVYHPTLDVSQDVDPARVDAWKSAGWLTEPRTEPETVEDSE